jgi:hypothetical protein
VTRVRDLGSHLFGRLGRDWTLIVLTGLTGYFDDAGTHRDSPVILYGGLIGNEDQWLMCEELWVRQLLTPAKGKPPVSRLRVYELQHALGEFEGYNEPDKDNTIYNFRNIILECGLRGYFIAIDVASYDELIVAPLRLDWGDVEQHCVTTILVRCGKLASGLGASSIGFVFDNRQDRSATNQNISNIFDWVMGMGGGDLPQYATVAFEDPLTAKPLQAADLVAYEYCRFVSDAYDSTGSPAKPSQAKPSLARTGRERSVHERNGPAAAATDDGRQHQGGPANGCAHQGGARRL